MQRVLLVIVVATDVAMERKKSTSSNSEDPHRKRARTLSDVTSDRDVHRPSYKRSMSESKRKKVICRFIQHYNIFVAPLNVFEWAVRRILFPSTDMLSHSSQIWKINRTHWVAQCRDFSQNWFLIDKWGKCKQSSSRFLVKRESSATFGRSKRNKNSLVLKYYNGIRPFMVVFVDRNRTRFACRHILRAKRVEYETVPNVFYFCPQKRPFMF